MPKDCPICLDTVQELTPFRACGHAFCPECIRNYFIISIKESRTDLKCPMLNCDSMANNLDINEALGERHGDIIEKWHEFSLRNVLLQNWDTRWCPGIGCQNAVLAGPEQAKCPQIICEACTSEFCYLCRQKWHHGRQCPPLAPFSGAANDTIKPCPVCQVNIEKGNGCNEIVCQICRTHFCWICGRTDISTFHFMGRGRCPLDGSEQRSRTWRITRSIILYIICAPCAPVLATLAALASIPAFPIYFGREVCGEHSRFGRTIFTTCKSVTVIFVLIIMAFPLAILVWLTVFVLISFSVFIYNPLSYLISFEGLSRRFVSIAAMEEHINED